MDRQKSKIGPYVIIYPLGQGSSAEVFAAIHETLKITVAIKKIDKRFANLNREIEIMKSLDHRNITSLYEIIEDEFEIYLVMELAENGNLLTFTNGRFGHRCSDDQIKKIFGQLCEAVAYLHNILKIAHRDLKMENILFDSAMNVKLADFGFSIQCQNELFSTACGSPLYVPPEVILRKPYDFSADIWSLGVILYYMIYGNFPFLEKSIPLVMKKIVNEDPVFGPLDNKELERLLKRMLDKDPQNRPTISEILNSNYLLSMPKQPDLPHPIVLHQQALDKLKSCGMNIIDVENKIQNHDFSDPVAVAYRIVIRDIISNIKSITGNALNRLSIVKSQAHMKPKTLLLNPAIKKVESRSTIRSNAKRFCVITKPSSFTPSPI
ncbi:CAMK family protein kinase [Tritrichomonas foetus]|uniref:CAMK family protein kinase n=1 Tax=Tritrichomonas foetus TaxID=1144522 RepID=A0A1J4K5J8_9EUKA|nr:CAMK family protein kinase [Tritrichomonas foetus]|eukprot:OHT06266.1 CAMK family protein kinase [Tritrichomonas foetus]